MELGVKAFQEAYVPSVANGVCAGIRSQREIEPDRHRQPHEVAERWTDDLAALEPANLGVRHPRRLARHALAQARVASRVTELAADRDPHPSERLHRSIARPTSCPHGRAVCRPWINGDSSPRRGRVLLHGTPPAYGAFHPSTGSTGGA